MDEKLTDELIEAILSPLEAAESRSLAVVRALTETGTISEEKLQPFLQEAENASEIKARGLRIRLKRVLADAVRQAENAAKVEAERKNAEAANPSEAKSGQKAEGPKQDPEEEARAHAKTADGKETESPSQNDMKAEEPKKEEATAANQESAA